VAHCPGANLKLASGYAPLPSLLAAQVNVALGADGAACNNTLDVFHEMRLAATMHLPNYGAAALPAVEALAMATVRGAEALGLSQEIGSIVTGKRADITVVDNSAPHFQPRGADMHATIVHCARASDVTDVLVDGRIVVRNRRLLTLDARKLATAASAECRRIIGPVTRKSSASPG
jgi:5-methylthioadenosine/S-adenosylhomocysteine deaminase